MSARLVLKPFDDSGFTLLELMTVVAVISVIAFMGASGTKNLFRTNSVDSQVEELRYAIQKVRNFTITSEGCGTVTIGNNSIATQTFGECGPPLGDVRPPEVHNFQNLELNPFSSGPTLNFLTGGKTDQNGPVSLDIKSSNGRNYQIRIMPAIGAIRLIKQ